MRLESTKHVTMPALANELGRHKTTVIRAVVRWQQKTGSRVLVGRAGGKQRRFLLVPKDAECFKSWYRDYPSTMMSDTTVDKEDLKTRLDEIDAELEEINDGIMDLQDRITDLKKERGRIAGKLDDLIDEEKNET